MMRCEDDDPAMGDECVVGPKQHEDPDYA